MSDELHDWVMQCLTDAASALERCNTIPLATAGFTYEANAISKARVALDKALYRTKDWRDDGHRTNQATG